MKTKFSAGMVVGLKNDEELYIICAVDKDTFCNYYLFEDGDWYPEDQLVPAKFEELATQ